MHVLDGPTRRDLRLEELWSGKDPLLKLNVFDDDAIEEYCQYNPVPERYNGTGSISHNKNHYDFGGKVAIKKLERTQFGMPQRHKPVISQAVRNRDRRAGRKRRRAQRQKEYFSQAR